MKAMMFFYLGKCNFYFNKYKIEDSFFKKVLNSNAAYYKEDSKYCLVMIYGQKKTYRSYGCFINYETE